MSQAEILKFLKKRGGWFTKQKIAKGCRANTGTISTNLQWLWKNKLVIKGEANGAAHESWILWKAKKNKKNGAKETS